MKCHRAYLSTLTCEKANLRPHPKGIVRHPPTISHNRSYLQLRYNACNTIPLMNEPLNKLTPLFPNLHLGRKSVSSVLQKGLSLGVLNLYHHSGYIFCDRRNSVTEVFRSLIQPKKNGFVLLKIQTIQSSIGYLVFVVVLANGNTFFRPCHWLHIFPR